MLAVGVWLVASIAAASMFRSGPVSSLMDRLGCLDDITHANRTGRRFASGCVGYVAVPLWFASQRQ